MRSSYLGLGNVVRSCLLSILVAVSIASGILNSATADVGVVHEAEIRSGSCGSLGSGPMFVLTPFTPQEASNQGDPGESSETVITYPAANLLTANLSVVVMGTAADADEIIACGAISEERLLATQGQVDLRFRLDEVGGSGHDGMAVIDKEGQGQLYVGLSIQGSAAASAAGLADLLPIEADVPSDLMMTDDLQRTLDEVAVNYGDPADIERRFTRWGWDGNVARRFTGSGESSGLTSVYVSLHRFGSADATAQALDYSFSDQVATTEATEFRVSSSLRERVRALTTNPAARDEVTIYAQQGTVLIRVTVNSISDDSTAEALRIAELVATNGERLGTSQESATQTPSATGSASDGGECRNAAAWWAETTARMNEINLVPEVTTAWSGEMATQYAIFFATLRDDQVGSDPPPAATVLNDEYVSILMTFTSAFELFASVQSGNVNPMAAPGILQTAQGQFDQAGSALIGTGQLVSDFTTACGLASV